MENSLYVIFHRTDIKMFLLFCYYNKEVWLFILPSLSCFMHQRYETALVGEVWSRYSKIYRKNTCTCTTDHLYKNILLLFYSYWIFYLSQEKNWVNTYVTALQCSTLVVITYLNQLGGIVVFLHGYNMLLCGSSLIIDLQFTLHTRKPITYLTHTF